MDNDKKFKRFARYKYKNDILQVKFQKKATDGNTRSIQKSVNLRLFRLLRFYDLIQIKYKWNDSIYQWLNGNISSKCHLERQKWMKKLIDSIKIRIDVIMLILNFKQIWNVYFEHLKYYTYKWIITDCCTCGKVHFMIYEKMNKLPAHNSCQIVA